MNKQISVVLSGIGGYGNLYVNAALDWGKEKGIAIAGVVDPYPDGCRRLDEINARGIPIFQTLGDFYKNSSADLAVICSPIHFHCEQTCTALFNGSHVLCEKPIAASPAEAAQMMLARNSSGKSLAIGYQWSYSRAVLEVKQDILSGNFGKPVKLKTIVLWPRDSTYYSRRWAGRVKDDEGRLVLDSVVNNATAHFLHNMFFVLGDPIEKSIMPFKVTAELYRANNIENFDTAAIRVKTETGVNIYYYGSHAVVENYGPVFEYIFENGVVRYNEGDHEGITAVFRDGSIKNYGNPYEDVLNKLWASVAIARGESAFICSVEAALPHAVCIEGMHRSSTVTDFPDDFKRMDTGNQIVWVQDLNTVLKQCYADDKLPSQVDIPWAVCSNEISV